MWTEAEHFANWYGPMGARIPSADMDVRVGGRRHVAMEMDNPGGPMQMFFVGEYREVDPKTRLEDLGARTKMTMTHIGVPADSPGGQGWAMAIDKMAARLAELRS